MSGRPAFETMDESRQWRRHYLWSLMSIRRQILAASPSHIKTAAPVIGMAQDWMLAVACAPETALSNASRLMRMVASMAAFSWLKAWLD